MAPIERDRRHLEQTEQVSRRRGIDDDARESSGGQLVAEDGEREQLVDARRRQREQVAHHRAIAVGHPRRAPTTAPNIESICV